MMLRRWFKFAKGSNKCYKPNPQLYMLLHTVPVTRLFVFSFNFLLGTVNDKLAVKVLIPAFKTVA